MRRAPSSVELGPGTSMLPEHFTWREPSTVPLGEPFEIGHDALGSQVVRVAQRPAAERRKPEPEDGADVAVARTPDDSLAECPCRLIHHAEHEPLQNLRGARAAIGMDTEQAVHAFVDATLLAALVDVEAAARLAAQPAFLHERCNTRARRRQDVVAVRPLHDARDFDRD